MRAVVVSVDYADLLAVTLPWNRRHFEDVLVVTAARDAETIAVAEACGVQVFCTDAFWEGGADLNKWRALEQGLDDFGRIGWLCLMDADVLWPKDVGMRERGETIKWYPPSGIGPTVYQDRGQICAPLRRMAPWPFEPRRWLDDPRFACERVASGAWLPSEQAWGRFPVHRNVGEWAGYSQVFHADDPALRPCGNCGSPREAHPVSGWCFSLGTRPLKFAWHQTDWRHAGGADSFFQERWPRGDRVRPPWECLHLGEAGANWCGRATPRLDGVPVPGAAERAERLREVFAGRKGKVGPGRFDGERLR